MKNILLGFSALAMAGCLAGDVQSNGVATTDPGDLQKRAGLDFCLPCLTNADCAPGSACVQIGGDDYCAPSCADQQDCSGGELCAPVGALDGVQVQACVPATGSCSSSGCGTCGSDEVCDIATGACEPTVKPAISKPAPAAVSGAVGPSGGSVSHLYFAITGDTRPSSQNATTSYPTAIIQKIYDDVQAMSPAPQFLVATGDFMYASTSTAADAQAQLYATASQRFTGPMFPVMGNHECNGYTDSNCATTTTPNFTAYMNRLVKPLGQAQPYYTIPFQALDGTWTAKLVVVACNAWNSTQQTWLSGELAKATTFTLVARHEPSSATTAPCVSAVNSLLKQYPYDLLLVGHTHTFSHSSREVVVGIGGAPLTGSGNYGFATVEQQATGFVVTQYDYSTQLPVQAFTVAFNCKASCSGKVCGSNGCGGSCGTCASGKSCDATGECISSCTPACTGKSCGDDGCGGSCGACASGKSCNSSGQCVSSCTPSCSGKACGDDGCGGSCGACASGKSCNSSGQCVSSCTPNCSGKACGDDGCGGSCGTCASGKSCNSSGQCVAASGKVVINEISTRGATAGDEMIELFNGSSADINLSGYKLYYRAASTTSGSGSVLFTLGSSAIIPAGKHFLLATSSYSGSVTPDATYSSTLADAGGSVWLFKAAPTSFSKTDASFVDLVGWGTAASANYEGSSAAPAPGAAYKSIERTAGVDTGNNGADFAIQATRTPQNTSSP